ncbi:Uncharacterised protein [Mycobacteroides abscessus subsp. abscessus]|nr:Uncharacterised protein [Mycobacteroides abscessus subsp. abscessus]
MSLALNGETMKPRRGSTRSKPSLCRVSSPSRIGVAEMSSSAAIVSGRMNCPGSS